MRWVWLDYLQMWCLRMRLFVNTSNQTSQTRHAAVDTKKRQKPNRLVQFIAETLSLPKSAVNLKIGQV